MSAHNLWAAAPTLATVVLAVCPAAPVPLRRRCPRSAVVLRSSTRHVISVWMTLALRWPLRLSRHGDGHAVLCWSGMTEGSELTRA